MTTDNILYKVCRFIDTDGIYSPLIKDYKYEINYSTFDKKINTKKGTLGIFCYNNIEYAKKFIYERLGMKDKYDFNFNHKFLHQPHENFFQYIFDNEIKYDYIILKVIPVNDIIECPDYIPDYKKIKQFYTDKICEFKKVDERKKFISLCNSIYIPSTFNENLIDYINNII